jgi:hypothetical protein
VKEKGKKSRIFWRENQERKICHGKVFGRKREKKK